MYFVVVFPNFRLCPPVSTRDHPGPSRNEEKCDAEEVPEKGPNPSSRCADPAMTLTDLLPALDATTGLSDTRLRDLRSSIKRVALLVGNDPAGIPFDLPAISAKLALVNPVAAGLTAKSFSNIRSNFITAVKASGLKSINRSAGTPLSPSGEG